VAATALSGTEPAPRGGVVAKPVGLATEQSSAEIPIEVGRERVVEVRVEGCTFGPHTLSFGIEFSLYIRDQGLRKSAQHLATLTVGRGGNNARLRVSRQ
jgi:hypothetical protein